MGVLIFMQWQFAIVFTIGGLLMFTDRLLKYNIDAETVKAAFDEVKNLRDGGIDELVTAWLVHKKGIRLKELDMNIYNTPRSL